MLLKTIDSTKQTQTELIGINHYCIYCGNKAIIDTEWDEYERSDTYFCNCELAKLEQEISKQIQKIQFEYYPKLKVNEKMLNKLKFDKELEFIKRKYKQI